MNWNASNYLRYGAQRTRAAVDLLARINVQRPERIVDLGCGPGNSTELLWQRWPESKVIGIDSSQAMIDAAKDAFPDRNWLLGDVGSWQPSEPFDVIYSNAALQWLPNHRALIKKLFSFVALGGALAFQIPSSTYATVRKLIVDISHQRRWTEQLAKPRSMLTMESPQVYYDTLVDSAAGLDLWETEYMHVLDSKSAIVDWIASTGLRPYLEALDSDSERTDFTNELQRRVNQAYDEQADGRVLFPFRRTFVIAYR